jgi:hypothetical protein
MDPMTVSSLLSSGSSLIKALGGGGPASAPPPPQRADGYAIGGMLETASPNSSSSGTTGGAYGGAFSQANVDGSNWTVSTGLSQAKGGGSSGGNGGLSPILTSSQGGVTPQSMNIPSGALGSGNLMLIGLAVLAYLIVKR